MTLGKKPLNPLFMTPIALTVILFAVCLAVSAVNAQITYTLTYTAGANGSISGTSPQTVDEGADGSAVTAVPDNGYHFVQWSDASTANPRTDTNVTGNITVEAAFAIDTYYLTYTADANGSISGTSPQTVDYGNSGSAVTAVPNTGYHFLQWSDASTANPRTDTNVMGNITVEATFTVNNCALTYTPGANGTLSGNTTQTVNYGGSGTAVTAVPDTGYHFAQWSDASTANPRTDTNVTGNITVEATFAINTYILQMDITGNGSTTPALGSHSYDWGTTVNISASPDNGWSFSSWSGDLSGNVNPTIITMDGNKTATANFSAIPFGGGGQATPPPATATPTPTPAPSPSPIATSEPTPTAAVTATPVATPAATASPTATPEPTTTPEPSHAPLSMDFDLKGSINENGVVTLTHNLIFNSGAANMEIPVGTRALTYEGKPLETIQMLTAENPPTLPGNCSLIGLAYDVKPSGATFNPFITITLQYDPNSLPKGVSEHSLYVAYADTASAKWVPLQGVVDPVEHNITAQVTHFTVFAILVDATLTSSSAPVIIWPSVGGSIGFLTLLALALYFGRFRTNKIKLDTDWHWNGKDWVPLEKRHHV